MRRFPFGVVIVGFVLLLILGVFSGHWLYWLASGVLGILVAIGIYDLVQRRNNILRNYPLVGHLRFLLLELRPEMRQYFMEGDTDGQPFTWDQRQLVYDRSEGKEGLTAFGTEINVYRPGYVWFDHSIAAKEIDRSDFRVLIGGKDCLQPYSCSVLNISAMSFGSLSSAAVMAMGRGAAKGNFAHCTGEGGASRYHLQSGADVIYQFGTGYFGCRAPDGCFDPEKFSKTAGHENVKMIEVKISQGAKPGHGGVLPGKKVTAEIAEARGVAIGSDCLSPPGHTAFSSPRGLCEFIGQLRELSGGKPIGIKLCIGRRSEFLAICKAILETGILPDYISVDGGEGGTGAAPVEFTDSVGMPLQDALPFVVQSLRGCGLKGDIKVGAAGKIHSAATIMEALAIGADFCYSARAFMLSVGCIQAQVCHTNECPVGIATQDMSRQRGVDPVDKGEHVYRFHAATMRALRDMTGAMGFDDPHCVTSDRVWRRTRWGENKRLSEEFPIMEIGAFVKGDVHPACRLDWDTADPDHW